MINQKLAVVLFLAIALAAAPTSFSHNALAVAVKSLVGRGTGTVTCPDGTTVNDVGIDIFTSRSKGNTGGSFSINFDSGNLVTKTLNQNHYTLKGSVFSDTTCSEGSGPIAVTISGNCGQDVPIHYVAANGVKGEFKGNVVCT